MLTNHQKRYLRSLAHPRKPLVTIGSKGIGEALIGETDRALAHHELLKVKLPTLDASLRQTLVEELGSATGAQVIQTIGRIGILYRQAPVPRIIVPDT